MKLLFLLLLLFLPGLAFGAVALDGTCSTSSTTAGTSLTWSHPTSGSNRFLVATFHGQGGSSGEVTGVTYNGVALSLKQRFYDASYDPGPGLEVYQLANNLVASGSHSVTISNADSVHYVGSACSFTGVDQTTPSGTVVTGVADPISVTVPANGMAYEIGLWGANGDCASPVATAGTKQFDLCVTSSTNHLGFGATRTTTGNFDWVAGPGAYVTYVALPINASAGGATVRRRVMVIQ